MAKSTTKKESTKSFDIEKIRRFTQTELENITSESGELPICYQIGADVLVGKYRVSKIDKAVWRVTEKTTQLFDFFNRKDAIFYCIALHKKQYKLAQDIKDSDELINRLEFDAMLYRVRYKKSQQNADGWGEDFYSTRYQETMYRIAIAKKEISNFINLAKYIKL